MNFKDILVTTPPEQWEVEQLIVFDWYDGPLEGLCELANPACCFYFKIVAERFDPDDLDDRLFRWNIMPPHSVKRATEILHALGEPDKPSWIPLWKFDSEDMRREIERALEELVSTCEQRGFVFVQTRDMIHFSNFWFESDRK